MTTTIMLSGQHSHAELRRSGHSLHNGNTSSNSTNNNNNNLNGYAFTSLRPASVVSVVPPRQTHTLTSAAAAVAAPPHLPSLRQPPTNHGLETDNLQAG